MSKSINLIGQRFGKLIVVERAENHTTPNGTIKSKWLCKCDCGNEKIIEGGNLKSGNTYSCGCVRKQNIYDLSGEYGIGYTSNTNTPFYFDLEDYDLINNYYWRADKDGYITTTINGNSNIKMHRMVMNCPKDKDVDHIFHKVYDNRKSELRFVNDSQNQMNMKIPKHNISGVKGVYWNKREQRWQAGIIVNKKRINLGQFKNKEDAINVRKQAEEKYYGEYAYKESEAVNK